MAERTAEAVKEHTRIQIKKPHRYCVVLLNDDFTTMDFVIEVLVKVFRKDPQTAYGLMMRVHQKGSARVGSYPYDIAVSKQETAMQMAREAGYPLRLEVREE